MISLLRRALSSWIVLALFALVIVAFIITGIGDPLGGGPAPNVVAEVGEEPITEARLADQFERTMQVIRQEQPAITNEQAVEQGALDTTLSRMINSLAIVQFARELGIGASKRLVDGEIAGIEAFRGLDGNFSDAKYREVLAQQRVSERDFRNDIFADVMRRQLLATTLGVSPTPAAMAEPYARLQLEQRTIAVGRVPYDRFDGLPSPTEEEIAEFYQANIGEYTRPERRRFSYALIDRAAIRESVEVSDEDVAAYYNERADEYGSSEQRALRQVVTQDETQAAEIASRVRGGESFAAVAADVLDYAPEDLELGTLEQAELASTLNDEVAAAVFDAQAETLVGPLESEFGYHVVRVDAVTERSAKPLDEVRDEIRQELTARRVEDRLADLVGEGDDALADGASVAEAAADLGLTARTSPALTGEGRDPDNPEVEFEARLRPLVARAFAYGEDEEPVVEEIGEGLYALLDVEEIIPPTPIPLGDVEENVRGALSYQRRSEAAQVLAEEIAAEVRAGTDLGAALRSRNLQDAQTATARRLELERRQEQGQRIPAYVALGFVQGEGDVRVVNEPSQGGQFIVETREIVPGNLEEAPALLPSIRSRFRQAAETELQLAFANAVTEEIGVERNENALNALKSRYLGIGLTGE